VTTDLGDLYPITVLVRDEDGVLTDTTSVSVAITLPTGAAASGSPFTASRVSVGRYELDYETTVAGLHSWTATASGAIEGVFSDTFVVVSTSDVGIVSLEDARGALRIGSSNTAEDEFIRDAILDVSDICEAYTGQVWRRTVVTAELADGGGDFIQLKRIPVLSITSVSESGVSVAASGYVLDADNGWLWRGTAQSSRAWAHGRQSVSVSYVAGPADGVVPRRIRRGALNFIRHLWEERRSGSGIPFQAGPDTEWVEQNGVQIPRRVAESWDLARVDGVA
jgi:hypothetical protein